MKNRLLISTLLITTFLAEESSARITYKSKPSPASHLSFSANELEQYLAKNLSPHHFEIPTEVMTFLHNRLKDETVMGIAVMCDSCIANLFRGQPYQLDFATKNEFEAIVNKSYELVLDWQKLNQPLPYSMLIAIFTNTENDLSGIQKNLQLTEGMRITFPMPSKAVSVTEITAHINENGGKLNIWAISLGEVSGTNFLKTGSFGPRA